MTAAEIASRAISKAGQSICKYRVSAIGLNSKGEIVGAACNRPRFTKFHGGLHAEMNLIRKALGRGLKTIILCRVNDAGEVKPIHPCASCAAKADELGIKIVCIAGV